MTKIQFRVLYRHYLFRLIDLELISAEGDFTRLLGQFAALLILLGVAFTARLISITTDLSPEARLAIALQTEHDLIAATMLAVGMFAVLSWDSRFPSRHDVMVLGPLPIRPSTIFLALLAATATVLGFTVVVLNVPTSLALSFAMMPRTANFIDLILSPAIYRLFGSYWIAMFAAGAFVFCSVLVLQGAAAQLLPRRVFLQISSVLQIATFATFLSTYFLQPALATPGGLASPQSAQALSWLPSYWFLGLLQQLNGSVQGTAWLAQRAVTSLAIVSMSTAAVYFLAYFRTLKRIVEEPDLVPASRRLFSLPPSGGSLSTAVVHFAVRTLLRSRQHRLMLAFYFGLGFTVLILFVRTPRAHQLLHSANAPLIFASLVMTCVAVLGTRVVLGVPIELRANWIFRMTQVSGPDKYKTAVRRPLFLLGVVPVWLVCACFFLLSWPWAAAVGHLVLLGLWGTTLAWVSLIGFHKIPFTCSWLPGKSAFHMAFLCALGVLFMLAQFAGLEQRALADPVLYFQVAAAFTAAASLARWLAIRTVREAPVEFEEVPQAAVLPLSLHRDGAPLA